MTTAALALFAAGAQRADAATDIIPSTPGALDSANGADGVGGPGADGAPAAGPRPPARAARFPQALMLGRARMAESRARAAMRLRIEPGNDRYLS